MTVLPGVRLNHERKSYNSQTLQNDFSCGILSLLKLSSTGTPETGQPHISAPAPGVRQGWSQGASGRTPPLLTGVPQNAPLSARLEYLQNEQMEGIPRNKRLFLGLERTRATCLKSYFFLFCLHEKHVPSPYLLFKMDKTSGSRCFKETMLDFFFNQRERNKH